MYAGPYTQLHMIRHMTCGHAHMPIFLCPCVHTCLVQMHKSVSTCVRIPHSGPFMGDGSPQLSLWAPSKLRLRTTLDSLSSGHPGAAAVPGAMGRDKAGLGRKRRTFQAASGPCIGTPHGSEAAEFGVQTQSHSPTALLCLVPPALLLGCPCPPYGITPLGKPNILQKYSMRRHQSWSCSTGQTRPNIHAGLWSPDSRARCGPTGQHRGPWMAGGAGSQGQLLGAALG